jgi:hypothetical protein
MKYQAPTYEEYKKATRFAKLRYKSGVYIQFISMLLLLFLLYYTVSNIQEMTTNPIKYAEEKLGVICYFPTMITSIPPALTDGSIDSIENIT